MQKRRTPSMRWLLLLALQAGPAAAESSGVLPESNSVFGEIWAVQAEAEETLVQLARRNGLGLRELKLVNPDVDTWLPGDAEVILPKKFILPGGPRNGIVLNIPEMRLYYYPPARQSGEIDVVTFPIGIGREGWTTPYLSTRVVSKQEKPSWYPPESIRIEHAAKGDILPKRVAPGPDNPLGAYAMRLGVPQYLIHGTNKPGGVGLRVSHGCIRLYPEDIEKLYGMVGIGTRVSIVNQPYKIGILDNRLFLEAHPFLDEDSERFQDSLTSVVKMIVAVTGEKGYNVDWSLAKQVVTNPNGIPVEIGYLTEAMPGTAVVPAVVATPPVRNNLTLQLETTLAVQQPAPATE